MRRWLGIGGLVVLIVLGATRPAWAQDAEWLIIHNVTSEVLPTGEVVLVISGVGFGEAPEVAVDGQAVPVLAGATPTRLTVLAPAAVLTVPGTYRLTVMNPALRVGDVFAVTGLAGTVGVAWAPLAGVQSGAATTGVADTTGGSSKAPTLDEGGGVTPSGVENPLSPYDTAYGYQALAANTASGLYNSAFGMQALQANTSGTHNTAVGLGSLRHLTTGIHNTAVGTAALDHITTTNNNTAVGTWALEFATGDSNTAVGTEALQNTTGSDNAALGFRALEVNSTGTRNAALGYLAGSLATTGHYNLFLGGGVSGTSLDTNTIRIGLPYDGALVPPKGQNRTFIAGIRGVSVSNALPVMIDANGQLGTADNSGNFGIGTASPVARLQVEGGEMRLLNGSGAYTHLNYSNTSQNYIRGTTYFDSGPVYFTGGNIGIGTTAPVARLQVEGGEMRLRNGNGAYSHLNYANGSVNYIRGTTYFDTAPVYFTGGNIGIGTTAPAYPLQMGSGAYVSAGGVWTNASSRTLKQQIAELRLEQAQAVVAALAPVTYEYLASPGERHVGFIAEDVPELVAATDRKSLSPMDIVAVVTKVVQEQQAVIADLQARLARLEALVASGAAGGVK